jgi:hypothetical protein
MCVFKDYPGYVALVSENSEVWTVNVHTMIVKSTTKLDFKGFHSITVAQKGEIEIIDSLG